MNIWSLKNSFVTFFISVILFYAHFFIPIFSIEQTNIPYQGMLAYSALFGFNLHAMHYMTIGLLPFISSGLMLGVFFSLNEELKNTAVSAGVYPLIERTILYVIAGTMAYSIVSKIPDVYLPYGRFVPWFEMMLSVYSIEAIFKLMRSSKLTESPIVIMLSLSVIGSCAHAALSGVIDWISLLFITATIIFSSLFFFKKFSLPINVRHFYAGNLYQEQILLKPRILQVGIMPAVYVSIVATPVSQYFSPLSNGYSEFIVLSPQWIPALIAVLWLLAYFMSRNLFRSSEIVEFGRFWDLSINGCEPGKLDFSMKIVAVKHALFFSCGITAFIVAQGAYIHYTEMSPVNVFIGGVSWLVVMSGVNDIVKGWNGVHYVK